MGKNYFVSGDSENDLIKENKNKNQTNLNQ